MVSIIQFWRGGWGNKVSGVQVNKRYAKVKYIDDRFFFRIFQCGNNL